MTPYDPVNQAIRCWVFHSGGGFGEGTMELKKDRFVLVAGVADGPDTELGFYPVRRSKEGQWTIDTIGEVTLPVTPPRHEKLSDLAWMVGEWVDDAEKATIDTTCSWTANRAFLRRSFQVSVKDRVDLAGLQVIGWDADAGQFRSWVFDSAGGFANETWSRDGQQWIVESAGVLFGGQKSSAVRIITPVDDGSFTLEAVDREVGGELLPDIDEVAVTRKNAGR